MDKRKLAILLDFIIVFLVVSVMIRAIFVILTNSIDDEFRGFLWGIVFSMSLFMLLEFVRKR